MSAMPPQRINGLLGDRIAYGPLGLAAVSIREGAGYKLSFLIDRGREPGSVSPSREEL